MKKPDIEITGLSARFYNQLTFIGTLGLHRRLMEEVIRAMDIRPGDRILDLGAGTGSNELVMLRYLGKSGNITTLEIGKEMRRQFVKNCSSHENVVLLNERIENNLPFREEFDKVFISFVIHGFPQELRERIVSNSYRALKEGGRLFILDWNEMELHKQGPMFRLFLTYMECEEARNFIQQDFKKILAACNFIDERETLYFKNRIRLLSAAR